MKSSQRIIPILVCIVLVSLLLPACASPTPSQPPPTREAVQTEEPAATLEPAPAQEATKVKAMIQPFVTFVPFYIAQEEGYYAEQGLEVELISVTVNQEILPALSSGQVDVSSGLISAGLLNAIDRGGDFKIVADKGFVDPDNCDNYALVARRDLAEGGMFKDASELRGHTVNVVPATFLEYYLDTLLETGSLTMEDIELSNVPVPAQPEAFEQKTLEMALNSEPWVTRFKDAGHSPVLTPPSELVPDAEAAVVLYGPTMLGEDRDVANRFMTAYLKAVRQYNEGKTPRNIELLAEFSNIAPEFLERMCWPALRTSGELNVQAVLDFQDWAVEAGHLDNAITAEQFYDASFVAQANSVLDSAQ